MLRDRGTRKDLLAAFAVDLDDTLAHHDEVVYLCCRYAVEALLLCFLGGVGILTNPACLAGTEQCLLAQMKLVVGWLRLTEKHTGGTVFLPLTEPIHSRDIVQVDDDLLNLILRGTLAECLSARRGALSLHMVDAAGAVVDGVEWLQNARNTDY